jgi:phospholipid/cholesterol/gamma-HCH transport system substrate-binding protein
VSRYLKIGLFVTITGVGLILYVMQTAETVGYGRTYTIHAYVNDASGLRIDSNVKLAGVDIGRLRNIELDGDRARLTLEIREDVQLYEDAVVAKATESMLGTATVSINPGSGRGAMLGNGDVVRNVSQSATISDAVGSANELAINAAEMVAEINRYLRDEETVEALSEIVSVARETAISTSVLLEESLRIARSTMQNIESFTVRLDQQSVDQLARVQEILDSTASLTARLDSLVGENDRSMSQSIQGIEENLESLRRVLASLETSADNVAEITRVVRDGEGNVGRLLNDDELYDRVVSISEKAEGFIDSTVGLGVQVGFRSEYLTTQADTKDHFELRLLPSSDDKFYSVGVVNSPVPRTVVLTTETVTTGTGDNGDAVPVPQNTVTTERTTSDELKLNLQLARIWGPLTVRAGVFESTAGIGMDLSPFTRLALSAEAFDFGAEDGAYLRGYGTVYPFYNPDSSNPLQWLYLSGGVDDILGVYERDYFVGAGVRFTDQDLRGLVGFIPIN